MLIRVGGVRFWLYMFLLYMVAVVTNAQSAPEREMEEIVVTGSHIKRDDTFSSSSPLRIIDEEYVRDQGNTDVANIMLDLPYVMGSMHVLDWVEAMQMGQPRCHCAVLARALHFAC